MGAKNIQIILLLFIGLLSIQLQCERRLGCAENKFSFEIGIKAYPNLESVSVGDTIWLELISSTFLRNQGDGNIINYSGAENLGSVVSFHKILDSQFIPGADCFELVLIKGKNSPTRFPESSRQYLFNEENGYFFFKLAVVARVSGTYRILFSRAGNVFRSNDRCTKASFGLNFEETNQHSHLNPYFQGIRPKGGDYYFVVKD